MIRKIFQCEVTYFFSILGLFLCLAWAYHSVQWGIGRSRGHVPRSTHKPRWDSLVLIHNNFEFSSNHSGEISEDLKNEQSPNFLCN